ncbi:E3 ubiquitin-protein ligase RBBP6-like isoform X6 [Vespa mandarinia]|uniref:E3 ubiquitin-protein ligase RBBP6-like isoform X6 n=1 Tax=Vespa mandarinia TaxID=7446 RepID=UPI0016127B7B|nr:E3 ubiquitin-protein ligase RBBP6-like isoform X6 [Vespa mandarinia]
MLCLKKRRTYSFTQGTCVDLPRRSKKDAGRYEGSLNMAITTLPRNNRSREERPSGMVLTVTEDTPADMLAGSMELLVQLPREHHLNSQRVTVQRSTPMMDLLVQIATAHKLAASSYTLQAIGERGLVLPHQPNTPIGALDALQVKLLPKQCAFVPKKVKPANQPFETTFRLQVHLPRNQLYVSRVSPKMNLGEILNEVCREKNLDKHKYELRHPVNLEEILDLSLSLQDYHLQEVTLYAKQGRTLGSALSSQDIMALQRQEERRRQQAKQSVFGFMFKKSKESSLSTDSLEGRSVSPARSDETGRSASPLQPPTRPQRKRRLAPKPPTSYDQEQQRATTTTGTIPTTTTRSAAAAAAPAAATTRTTNAESSMKEKMLIGHSRNSSDSSGYHEASVLSDNPDSAGRLPETLPRRNRTPGTNEIPRKLVHTSQSSKSLGNLAVTASGASLDRALSSSSLSSSTGLKKKRAAPPPPVSRPLSAAISNQALERIDDSEESLTSDMDPSKPPSDIGAPSKASSDIGLSTILVLDKADHPEMMRKEKSNSIRMADVNAVEDPPKVENARVEVKREVERKLCDTDALLHKVSETLSSSSLASSNEETENVYNAVKKTNTNRRTEEDPDEDKENPDYGEERKNQQDTSDYVSALEEDSSMADWEYQLPAPPSAFRDTDSSLFDGYDTVTLRSVEAFKESLVENRDDRSRVNNVSTFIDLDRIREIEGKTVSIDKDKSKNMESQRAGPESKFKKEVISELETKIERGTLARSQKEPDSKKVNSGTPTLTTSNFAPVDNTLSNFTITTYTRQKSIDIFKEKEDKCSLEDEASRNKKTEPKISNDVESTRVWQAVNAKAGIVKRSKSHASAISKANSKNEVEGPRIDPNEKTSSSASVSDVDIEDKFTQRRNNRQEESTKGKEELRSLQVLKSILPQLTSSQPAEENVSKERNVVTREKAKARFEASSDRDHSVTPSVISSRGESHVTAQRESKGTMDDDGETRTKRRYAYNGPPAISLGSWAERPTFKVQIKTDTDYKFQRDKLAEGGTIDSKEKHDKRDTDDLADKLKNDATIVFGTKRTTFNETIARESKKNEKRPIVTSVELKKTGVKEKEDTHKKSMKDNEKDNEKLIDTTPLNFQELTKAFRIDIEHRIKPTSQRANANRHSDYYGPHQEFLRKKVDDTRKQNGQPMNDEFSFKRNIFQKDNALINGNRNINANSEGNQFGSFVGINSVNHRRSFNQDQTVQRKNNVTLRNNNANGIKPHPMPIPIVKGFKVSTMPFKESKVIKAEIKVNQNDEVVEALPPKAPTMPVIMGVTLKSTNARPKSMPINVDPRDMLLESIRNFGGRGKLKNIAERY